MKDKTRTQLDGHQTITQVGKELVAKSMKVGTTHHLHAHACLPHLRFF